MFYFTINAINLVHRSKREFIYGDTTFTRDKKCDFKDFTQNIIFNKRKTIRNNIDNYLKYCNYEIEDYRKQSFSEQMVS